MSGQYAVHFYIRKGLGPDRTMRTVFVGLDDLPDDVSYSDLRSMIIADAEEQLRGSEDYHLYGKNWEFSDFENC